MNLVRRSVFAVVAAVAVTICLPVTPTLFAQTKPQPMGGNWPQFRGPGASGIAADGVAAPIAWNVDEKKNLLWKTAVPGLGHSSPIVWGEKVYVTSAISGKDKPELKAGLYGDVAPVEDDTSHQFKVYCVNKGTGKVEWERVATRGVPKVKRHTKATHANPTMATDGKNVLAFFGSEGLFCYDPNGKLMWKRDFGVLDSGWYMSPDAQWGFSSSPIIVGNRIILQCDVQRNGFLAALDIKTGKDIWRTPRTDVPTWGTPTVVRPVGGKAQIAVNGWKHIGGYDLATGRPLWRMASIGGDLPVPTPVYGQGLIFFASAHGRSAPLYAVRPDATGDISLADGEMTNKSVAWSTQRNGAYMQTPLILGEYIYSCTDAGVLTCYEVKTGKQIYRERVGTGRTGFTASPVAANGKLYLTSEEGDVYVVKAGPKFEILGTNPLGEVCLATPAISEGVLFWHTQGHLVAVGSPVKSAKR